MVLSISGEGATPWWAFLGVEFEEEGGGAEAELPPNYDYCYYYILDCSLMKERIKNKEERKAGRKKGNEGRRKEYQSGWVNRRDLGEVGRRKTTIRIYSIKNLFSN